MKTTLAQAALTEGVTPDGHTNVVKTVTAVPVQLGDYSIISDVLDVETKLKRKIKRERWNHAHHLMIFFGRYFCKAMNPNCIECQLYDICKETKKKKCQE